MRIPLHLNQDGSQSAKEAQSRVVERDILAIKKGDWDAKRNLGRVFMPLLTSLAQKRATDAAELNRLIEAGKEGLYAAAMKYKVKAGAQRFQIFALDFIEKSMGRPATRPGFFARLFGRR